MDLIASFSSQKINRFHFFDINGILDEDKDLVFLFDPGAACPVIGVNSFFSFFSFQGLGLGLGSGLGFEIGMVRKVGNHTPH